MVDLISDRSKSIDSYYYSVCIKILKYNYQKNEKFKTNLGFDARYSS